MESTRVMRTMAVLCGSALAMAACRSAAPVAPAVVPGPPPIVAPDVPLDRKVAWVLRLEQQRLLKDPSRRPVRMNRSSDRCSGRRARSDRAGEGSRCGAAASRDARDSRVRVPEGLAALTVGWVIRRRRFGPRRLRDRPVWGRGGRGAGLGVALKDSSALVRGRAIEAIGPSAMRHRTRLRSAIADVSPLRPLLGPIDARDETQKPPEVEACGSRSSRSSGCASTTRSRASRSTRSAFPCPRGGRSRSRSSASAPRAADALLTLVSSPGVYTASFDRLRGLARRRTLAR